MPSPRCGLVWRSGARQLLETMRAATAATIAESKTALSKPSQSMFDMPTVVLTMGTRVGTGVGSGDGTGVVGR